MNRAIIIGSGASVKDGLLLGLNDYLANEVTFGINEAVKFVDCTAYTWGDWTCYRDRFDLYKEKELVIGKHDMHVGRTIEGATPCPKQDDLVLLKGSGVFFGQAGLEKGLYFRLTGTFTLHLAIELGFKFIFLLGFDNREINGFTHFYEGIEGAGQFRDYEGQPTCGVGKNERGEYRTSAYNHDQNGIDQIWHPFETAFGRTMIYNVSPQSRITTFKKIDYLTMFELLKKYPANVNQDVTRHIIRKKLKPYNLGELNAK